jgi:hypothetical protein
MSNENQHKSARVRSPAYPAFDLKTAIEKTRTIYQHEKRSPAPVAVVTKHCGLDIKSSGGLRLIAALKQFGLVVESDGGEDRKVKLSDLALDILLAENDSFPQRISAIKAAALRPKIHKNLWDNYKGELPSDASMKAYLIREMEFNDASVDKFIKEFRSTLAFARLGGSDILPPADEPEARDNDDEEEDHKEKIPARQRGRRPVQSGTREDVFTVSSGDVVVQWPEQMTTEEIQDFEDWMTILVRKVKRSAQLAESTMNRAIQRGQQTEDEEFDGNPD